MKKITITALCLYFSFIAVGQPVLNASDINPLNYTGNTYNASSTIIGPGVAGANQNWDFSNLILTQQGNLVNNSVVTAPYASSFPNSNFYISSQPQSDSYAYYNLTSVKLEVLGVSTSNQIILNFYNPQTIFVFPFTFNTVINDTYQYNTNPTISFYSEYDAYGTVTTAFGTFNNVIRLKQIDSGITTYTWFKANPYEDIISVLVETNGTKNYSVFEKTNLATEKKIFAAKFSIAPNPTNGILTINNLEDLNSENFINVFDILGNQIIKNEPINGTSTSVNISDYASGLYLIKITDANEKVLYTDKIIKN